MVDWVCDQSKAERAPGLIVGISGTDSILTFLVCAEAFKRLGKQNRVIGVHFGLPLLDQENRILSNQNSIACVKEPFNWVIGDVFPWLKKQAPDALLEVDSHDGYDDDNIRWGRLFSRAVSDTTGEQDLSHQHYFPVGTLNATEDFLGTYSQISKAVSLQPLIDLYKSEVLELCRFLNVPEIAIEKSAEIDCACGRYDTAAHYIKEIDAYVMVQKKELDRRYFDALPQEAKVAVMEYVLEEKERNSFRMRTPYRPQKSLIIV